MWPYQPEQKVGCGMEHPPSIHYIDKFIANLAKPKP